VRIMSERWGLGYVPVLQSDLWKFVAIEPPQSTDLVSLSRMRRRNEICKP
jgi:hypothetical protein